MVSISIDSLRLKVLLGAYDWELQAPQDVFADISLDAEVDEACRSDELKDTVDYGALAGRIAAATGGGRVFHLVEALAAAIASTCLAADGRISAVRVTIRKPSALPNAAAASASISKSRKLTTW